MLRDANGGEKDQGPLKDASGMLPPELASEFGAPHPPAAKRVAAKRAKAHSLVVEKTVVSAASIKRRTAKAGPQDDVMSDSVH
jgi:hypothetical protein